MRNRMLILAAVALILSVGVTYLAYRVFQSRLQPPEETSNVVVAARRIALGTRITKDDIKLAKWPKSTPIEGGFTDTTQVIDRAAMIPLDTNEPILETKLAPKEGGAGLTAVIPEGMRALSIQVNSIIGVAGFVLPGSRVDLILIGVPPSEVNGARAGEQASKIILENLQVIAAGQNVQRDVEGKPQTVQVVTLLLSPEQAEKVALATGEGRIQLALRNPLDKEAAEPPLVVKAALYTGPTMEGMGDKATTVEKPAPPPPRAAGTRKSVAASRRRPVAPKPIVAPPPQEPRVFVVEVIQGARRSKQSFEEEGEPEKQPELPPGGQIP
jgi:pilus assembly protein CpaB